MTYRLGVDIGGTFTDFALLEPASGRVAILKRLTTPEAPERAVLEGAAELLAREGVPLTEVSTLAHGTTLITNATIERRGAVTGMLVTRGFRDVVDIGVEQRYDLFDLRLDYTRPLVPRRLRVELAERILYDGRIERALDLDEVHGAVAGLIERFEIEALAICLLHAYANSSHEQQIKTLIEEQFPQLHLSCSGEVSPFMREYERWSTTIVNAYTQPMAERYLERLETGLRDTGFDGNLLIMTSSGGIATTETARRFPVRLIESGPAAGALMCAFQSELLGHPQVLSFDMGGTTTKGALIRDHAPLRRDDVEVARAHEFKKGSGLPLKIPAIDMIEIGSGGGSIAEADQRGVIRVGPRSAGANPGPASYRLGGEEATLTDANLVLGYLDPAFFLGGEMRLAPDNANGAIEEKVAGPLGLESVRAAWGIHETTNEDVARAFRVHAAERGFDYRASAMIAFGGSGPAHALRIARKLKVPRVIFPAGAGVMSAFGLLVSPLSFELVRSDTVFLDDITALEFEQRFRPLTETACEHLRQAGVSDGDIRVSRRLDMRYRGQGHEIEVAVPQSGNGNDDGPLARLPALFAERYREIFSLSFLEQPLEIVNWKLEAAGPRPEMGPRGYRLAEVASHAPEAAIKGTRRAYFPERGDFVDCPVYDRYAMRPGMSFPGPALVEERESTCVVGTGDRATVDDDDNLVAELGENQEGNDG